MATIALVNPNTSKATTRAMVEIAQAHAGTRLVIEGVTAPHGAPLITDETALEVARGAVASLAAELSAARIDGVIVAAFGDPGLDELRAALQVPVAGIGEAGIAAAASGARRFAIVSTTPGLQRAAEAKIARLQLAAFYAGTENTVGDPVALTADPGLLETALADAISRAVDRLGAEAIVIGGGPLAKAARALAPRFAVPIIEPLPEAVDWLLARRAGRPA